MRYEPTHPNMDDLFPQSTIPKMPTYEKGKSPYELMESQSAYLEKTSKELHDMGQSCLLYTSPSPKHKLMLR